MGGFKEHVIFYRGHPEVVATIVMIGIWYSQGLSWHYLGPVSTSLNLNNCVSLFHSFHVNKSQISPLIIQKPCSPLVKLIDHLVT